MRKFNSNLVQENRLLPGIHGLRGIAALAVVFYHLIHIAGIEPPLGFKFIGRDFGLSVHLFFILSAYSLMYSTESKINQPNWLTDYFIKRFFRIAPLFYSMIIFFVLAFGYRNVNNIILNLTFTFGFAPPTGFVWGGWSVGVEMIFYAIFPVLLLLIRTHRATLIFLIISIIISCILRSELHSQHLNANPQAKYDWSYFSFASNMCFFAMGMYAYRLSELYKADTKLIRIFVPIVALIIISALLFSELGQYLYGSARFDIVFWGVGLSALCIWQGSMPSVLIGNKFFEYLGERSFSIYLLHPVVILYSKNQLSSNYQLLQPYIGSSAYFVCAALLISLILIFAEFTYRFIEVPGIKLGRKLIKTRKVV